MSKRRSRKSPRETSKKSLSEDVVNAAIDDMAMQYAQISMVLASIVKKLGVVFVGDEEQLSLDPDFELVFERDYAKAGFNVRLKGQ